MLPSASNHPSDLDTPLDDKPSVVYDLDTGAVEAPVYDLTGAPPSEPIDPLRRDIEKILSRYRAFAHGVRLIGERIKASVAEFKSTYSSVRADRGIWSVFLGLVWDGVSLRLMRVLPILAFVILTPLLIVWSVKMHKKAHQKNGTTMEQYYARANQFDREQERAQAQRTDFDKAFQPAPSDADAQPHHGLIATPASPDPVRDAVDEMPPILKYKVAHMIAQMQLNDAKSPGDPLPPAISVGTPSTPVPTTDTPPAPAPEHVSNTPSPTPHVSAIDPDGNGTEADAGSPDVDYATPDGFTNGDENKILVPLYAEWKTHQHTADGKQAGIDLAELYWLRAGEAARAGHPSVALTDWKRVVKFDGNAPIAKEASQNMKSYGANRSSKKSHAKRPVPGKNVLAKKHHAATRGGVAKGAGKNVHRHSA